MEIWKIQQKTIKNVCQLRLNGNFAKKCTVNCNIVDKFSNIFQNLYKKEIKRPALLSFIAFPKFSERHFVN